MTTSAAATPSLLTLKERNTPSNPELIGHFIDEAFIENPYPAYAMLREKGPIHWCGEFCGGAWVLVNYVDVASALQDPRFSVQRAGNWVNSIGSHAREELLRLKSIMSRALLFVDGKMHMRLRRLMNAGFRPALIQSRAPRIEAIANQLLDRFRSGKPFDFIEDFARPLPSMVIADLLGVDPADHLQFADWSENIAAFIGSPSPTMELARSAQASLVAMTDYFNAAIQAKRGGHETDLLGLLVTAEREGKIRTSKELLAQCAMLLFAGQETTRHLLGNSLLSLLQNREQWEEVRAHRSLSATAVRELLRYHTPIQYTGRRLTEDIRMHGSLLRKGELVIPLIGAANRDPIRFTKPDELNLTRNEGSHLGFGTGPHVCIGAALTMLEAQIAFNCILQRMPSIRLGTRLDAAEPYHWIKNPAYRGLSTLHVIA